MTRDPAPPDRFRVRLGAAFQRQRQQRGLSQSQLAQLANLSLKYIGEVERGDANLTMDALERIASALQWDPLEQPGREHDTLPEGVRALALTELFHILQLVGTAIGWLQRSDSTSARRAAGQAHARDAPIEHHWGQEEKSPIRRRGRPRKPRAPAPHDPES